MKVFRYTIKRDEHWRCVQCAMLLTFVIMLFTPMIVQINYPELNVSIELFEKDGGTTALETKRANEADNRVWANYPAIIYNSMGIKIAFINNIGDSTKISDIIIAVGKIRAAVYTEFMEENVSLHDLEFIRTDVGKSLTITGAEPYIRIDNVLHVIAWAIILNFFMALLESFVIIEILYYGVRSVRERFNSKKNIDIIRPWIKMFGLTVIYIYISYILVIEKNYFSLKTYRAWEVFFFSIALVLNGIMLYFLIGEKKIKMLLLGEILIAPFLWMAIWNLTTYLTVDERCHIKEHYSLQAPYMWHWSGNSSHVNYAIMGTIWKIIPQRMVEIFSYEQLGKLLHWLCGIILIILISKVIVSQILKFENSTQRLLAYTIIMNVILSIPVVNITLKNYNYDLFSLMFSILAVIKLVLFLEKRKNMDALWSLFFATSAIMEKMTAMLVWLACMVVLTAIIATEKKIKNNIILSTFVWTIVLFSASLALVYINQIYVLDILMEVTPYHNLGDAFNMLCEMPLRGVSAVISGFGVELSESGYLWLCFLGMIIGIWITANVYLVISKILTKKGYIFVNKGAIAICMIFVILGVSFAFVTSVDIAISSRLEYVMYFIKEFIKGIPTATLVLCFATLVYGMGRKRENQKYYIVSFLSAIISSIFFTIVYDTEFIGARYAEIYIVLFILFLTIIFIKAVKEKLKYIMLPTFLLICATIITGIENFDSLPAFNTFYPFYYTPVIQKDELGVYAYNGEVNSIVGEMIIAYCKENKIDLNKVTICDSYLGAWHGGEWLTNEYNINLADRGWVYMGYEKPDKNDFFIFETQTIKRNELRYGLPNAEPIFTLTYRGAITARIYRGDDLVEYFAQY